MKAAFYKANSNANSSSSSLKIRDLTRIPVDPAIKKSSPAVPASLLILHMPVPDVGIDFVEGEPGVLFGVAGADNVEGDLEVFEGGVELAF